MAIRCECPGCKNTIEVADDQAGQPLQCRLCRTAFSAPHAPQVAAAIQAGLPATAEPFSPSTEPSGPRPARPERARRDEPWSPPRRPADVSPLPWILAGLGLFVLLAVVVGGALMFFWVSEERAPQVMFGPAAVEMDEMKVPDFFVEGGPQEIAVDPFEFEKPEVAFPPPGNGAKRWTNFTRPAPIAWAFPEIEGLDNRLQKELLPNNQTGPLGRDGLLWGVLEKANEERDWEKSQALRGHWGAKPFEETAPDGGLLLGFYCTVQADGMMDYVQPIYFTRDGEKLGKAYGALDREPYCLKAKPGYAVGAIRVSSGDLFDGMGLTFMRVNNLGLDVKDRYHSPWVGGNRGQPNDVAGDGSFIIGIHGRLVTQGDIVPHGNIATLGALSWRP